MHVCIPFNSIYNVAYLFRTLRCWRLRQTRRSPESDVNDDVAYNVYVTTLYAGEPDVEYGKSISFTTPSSPNDCGVDLGIGGDYLLSLFRTTSSGTSDSDQGGPLTLHACDLSKSWRYISYEEKEDLSHLLEGNDDDYDDYE